VWILQPPQDELAGRQYRISTATGWDIVMIVFLTGCLIKLAGFQRGTNALLTKLTARAARAGE